MFKTEIEVRGDARIFAGSDPAFTAMFATGFKNAVPALTPLMLDAESGLLVPWDGEQPGLAVAVLALDHDGVAGVGTCYKSGTFDTGVILWPEGATDAKKRNAFAGTAISIA